MVSHSVIQPPPPPYSDLTASGRAPSMPALTRAPSIASSRSYSRRHRHARSQHGGSAAHLPQNEFPVFSLTGDVEIIISNASGRRQNRYVLHRLILSQYSGFFDAGTSVEWSATSQTAVAAAIQKSSELDSLTIGSSSRESSQELVPSLDAVALSKKRSWRYEIDWSAAAQGEPPMLVQRDDVRASLFGGPRPAPPVRSKPPTSNETFFRTINAAHGNHQLPSEANAPGDEIMIDYDNLFRIMYQYPPILDTANIATAYSECKALLRLADMYDALEIVGNRVDHHLLRFGMKLFRQIAKYPPSYLKLGYLAQSQVIFTEAMVHVVGQWPMGARQLRGQVNADVMHLIEEKVDDLREAEERIEFRLWRLTLTTLRGERVTPATDYLAWLALSQFRQWLADNTTPLLAGPSSGNSRTVPETGSQQDRSEGQINGSQVAPQRAVVPAQNQAATPNVGRVYRLLGSSSNDTYLGCEELKAFLKLTPDLYHSNNLRRFERRMNEIKSLAREVVAPLMRNSLELDSSYFGPAGPCYLTCTKLAEVDLPWEH